MLFITTLLLCDMVLFFVLGKVLSCRNRIEDILLHYLFKTGWPVVILFPWFAVLLVLVQPARRLYWNNRDLYSMCQFLLNGVGIALMIDGALGPDSWISPSGLLLCLWLWIADILVHAHRDGGDLDSLGDPIWHGPTPTGDAAEIWLKKLNRQLISR